MLGNPDLQVEWYHKAFYLDCTRREPLVKLAQFFQHNKNPMSANAYATAALEIGWSDHYANDRAHYEHIPHEILYWAKGWFGDIEGAKKHLTKALEFQPYNPNYLRDTKFYFEYADQGIEGYMRFAELTFLYSMSKQVTTVAEVGSFKGRSTHALLSGGAHVTAIDHFQGSSDPGDWTHHEKDSFGQFCKNTAGFKNLTVKKMSGKEASMSGQLYDMVFIDAGHTYEEVKQDILNWQGMATIVFCGHDYSDLWPGVKRAVDELVGPVLVHDSIWYKFMAPKVSIILPTLGRPEGLKRCLESIDKLRYPKALLETIVIHDQPIKGVSARVKEGFEKSTGQFIVFAANDMEFDPNCIMEAVKCHRATKMGLISFNSGLLGPDNGNICEHFMIDRRLVDRIGGEIFSTRLHHVGTDNLLWAKCDKLNEAIRCESALFTHHHFSKGAPMDDVYNLGWAKVDEDRAILAEELAKI
jgi:hypothetical protein